MFSWSSLASSFTSRFTFLFGGGKKEEKKKNQMAFPYKNVILKLNKRHQVAVYSFTLV